MANPSIQAEAGYRLHFAALREPEHAYEFPSATPTAAWTSTA